MARNTEYITFEGQYEKDVLGVFQIIRGFADLRDLAEVSVPYQMKVDNQAQHGYQREINQEHAISIKKYLEESDHRFIPEIILSLRANVHDEENKYGGKIGILSTPGSEAAIDGVTIKRRWKSKNIKVHRIRVKIKKLDIIKKKGYIRRIDGNHRLALAKELKDDPNVPQKYLAPFCLILLGPVDNADDDYSESLIFHILNSKALPLESEHALRLILGQDSSKTMPPDAEFAYSPDLFFTRLLRDGLLALPQPTRDRLGKRPYTSLNTAAKCILEMKPECVDTRIKLQQFSESVLDALNSITTVLSSQYPELCKTDYFIDLATRAWIKNYEEDQATSINQAISYIEELAKWMGREGLQILEGSPLDSRQLIETFDIVCSRRPQRVFLARWYPSDQDGHELTIANNRLDQIKRALTDIKAEDDIYLELEDMGTQEGGTFPIQSRMYEAIEYSDIILIDLSGVRPNVCIEAGYALKNHEKNRLIFIFQKTNKCKKVPFDLETYRYEKIDDTGDIPAKIKPHIKAIMKL